MRKAVGRETTGKEKSRETAATKKAAGKRSSTKPALRRAFDPDALLNSMDGMVFVASPEYRIEYMNEAALRKIGRDMTGKHCFKVFHGLEERCPWCMGELVLQGQSFRQEILGQLDKRWYSNVLTPLHRKDGSVAIQALVFDITDQKEAQAVLVQNEALLRSIHQAAPMGTGVVRSRVLDWTNEQISRMTGYTAEELRGKSARIFYADDEEFDRVGRHKYADIHSKGTGSIVTVWRRKDGRLINVYLSSTPIDPGDLSAGVVFTALDITEKKKAQDDLWRSEEKYQALFDNAVMGIFQSTPEGRFITVNPATATMCGFDSPEEMVAGITDIATQHYVDPAERGLFIRAIEEQGFVRNFEHRTYRKDGSVFWVSVNARVVRDRRGRITHYEGTHEDIQCRKAAEEKQRQSEEKYRHIFENTLVGIFQSTPEGRYISVNPAFARIYGYDTPEDVIASVTEISSQIFVDPEDRRRCLRILNKTGILERYEARTRRRDGSIIWTVINSRIVRDKEGRPLFIEGVIEDITERKLAEKALRASEERFIKVFQSNPIPMTIATIDEGRLIDVNDRTIELSGYSREEMIGRTSIEIGLWAYPQERDRLIAILRETGSLRDGMAHFKTKAGDVKPALWSADAIQMGEKKVLLTTIHDISQQVEAQEKLKRSEALLKSVLEAAPIGIGVVHNRVLSWVNEGLLSMTGHSLDELSGKSSRVLYADDGEYERVGRVKYEQIATSGKGVVETRWKAKDGSLIDIFLSSSPIDPGDLGAGVVFTAMDISGLKRAEEARKQLEGQLRQAQKMEAIGTLAGGIAHDFNNILFTIVGFTDLSLHDARDGETRWNLTQVLNACDRAKNLVNQILAFSRQEAPERRPVDIVPVAKDALKFLRSTIPSTVELKQRIAGGSLTVLSDSTTIHQVLINLGTNAAHAMRTTGGVMEVCIEGVEIPRDRGSSVPADLKPGPYIRMTVRDTGVGIDPAIMNRIFDPFFTTKPQGEGTGLGLSVVYGIVKSHGGSVTVESEVGRGSTFHVYLPRTPETEHEDGRNKAPACGGSEHILFVDDEVVLVDMGERILNALGYRVTAVANGPDALATFRENPDDFDLVITDMTMPGMTGAELSREILKIKPGVPIILCTGFSEFISEGEAKAMGIRRFLMKPVFLDTLAGEIRTVLDSSRREVA